MDNYDSYDNGDNNIDDNAILANSSNFVITIMFVIYILVYLIDVFLKMNRNKLFYLFFSIYVFLGVFLFLLDSYRSGSAHFDLVHLFKIIIVTLLMIFLPKIINLIAKDIYWLQALIIILCPIYWFFVFFVEKTNLLFKIQTIYFFALFILFSLYLISTVSMNNQITDTIEDSLRDTELSVGVFDGIKELITKPIKDIKDNTDSAIDNIVKNINNEMYYFQYGYYPNSVESNVPEKPTLSIEFTDKIKNVYDTSEDIYFTYSLNIENYGKPINVTTSAKLEYNSKEESATILRTSQTQESSDKEYNFKLIKTVPLSATYSLNETEKLESDLYLKVKATMHMQTMSLYNPFAILDNEVMNLNQEPLSVAERDSVSNVYQPGPIAINLLTNLNYIILTNGEKNSIAEILEFSLNKNWEGELEKIYYVYIRTPKYIPIKKSLNAASYIDVNEITNDQEKIYDYCIEPCLDSRGDQTQCESLCNTNNYNFYEINPEGIDFLNNQIKKIDDEIGGFRFLLDTSHANEALNFLKKNQVFFSTYVLYDYTIKDETKYDLIKFSDDE